MFEDLCEVEILCRDYALQSRAIRGIEDNRCCELLCECTRRDPSFFKAAETVWTGRKGIEPLQRIYSGFWHECLQGSVEGAFVLPEEDSHCHTMQPRLVYGSEGPWKLADSTK